jgi:hypothetical protein
VTRPVESPTNHSTTMIKFETARDIFAIIGVVVTYIFVWCVVSKALYLLFTA